MAYEMKVDASVAGQQQLAQLTAATEKQEDRTKRVALAIQGYIQSNSKLSETQAKLALDEVKLEQLREKHRMQLEKLAAAAQKRAETEEQANARIGASVKNFITNPLGAAGDAAEKFVVSYGKVGIAAGGVGLGLAVVSGWLIKNASDTAKYAQETANLASRTGLTTTETQLYTRASEVAGVNAGTLTTAMRTLSRGMSENSDEGKKQKKVLEELGLGAEAAFKPMGELLPELFQKLSAVGNAMERDRMTITLFGRSGLEMEPLFAQFKQLEARVSATGVIMDAQGIQKAAKYREQLVLLGLQWDALKLSLGQGAIGVIRFVTGGGDINLKDTSDAYSIGRMVRNAIVEGIVPGAGGLSDFIAKRNQGEDFDAAYAAGVAKETKPPTGPSAESLLRSANAQKLREYNLAHEDVKTRLDNELKRLTSDREDAEQRFTSAAPGSPKQVTARAGLEKIDQQIAATKEQIKAAQELKGAIEREIELRKRSEKAFDDAFYRGEDSAQRRYDRSRTDIAADRADELRKPGANAARINADFDLQQRAAFVTYVADAAKERQASQTKLDKMDFRGQLVAGKDEDRGWDEVYKTADKLADALLKSVLKAANEAREGALKVEEDSLRNLRNTGQRRLSQIGIRNQLAGGSEGQEVSDTYNLRISLVNQEYAQRLKIAALLKTTGEQESARKIALADKDQQIFDARMAQENALLEIALRQKQEFQSLAVGFVDAARSGGGAGIQKFLIGQLNKIEDTIVGNAAGLAWPTIQKAMGGMHAQAGTTMGKLLEGTPFGPDPLKTAGMTLTQAGTDLIQAAADLRAAATSPSGGGGSAGGGWNGAASRISGMWTGAGAGAGGGIDEFTPDELKQAFGETGPNQTGSPIPGDNSTPNTGFSTQGYSAPGKGGLTVGKGIGYGVAAAGAAYGAYEGFKAGGAQGALQGTGSILGAASLIPGPQQPFIMAAAMATTLISSILGDPKQRRENEIQNELKYNQYMAPVAINASMTTGGTYADFDRFGAPRGSNLSPFPTVEQGFFDYRHNITVPGRTDSAFGGPGGTPITVNVQTLDSRSFNENSHLVADAVQHAIQTGRGTGLQETLRHL